MAGDERREPRGEAMSWDRLLVTALDLLNRRGPALGIRLARLTGKSRHLVHPKHLVEVLGHHWYLEHVEPSDVVLDVGCAHGAHALAAAGRVKQVVGVDYDVIHLRTANARARALGIDNVRMIALDITRPFPFPDSSFDAGLFLDVIEHLEPRQQVLAEIARVLKPGARLLVSAPNRDTSWRRRLRAAGLFALSDPDHKIEYTRDELLAELARGGFVTDGPVLPVVYDTPWAGAIDVVGGVSLGLYARLARWKHEAALRHPEESIGFRVVARRCA